MKKKKTVGEKHNANPLHKKKDVTRQKKKDVTQPEQNVEKSTSLQQPGIKTGQQKVVNEQEENQIVNDVEETAEAVAEN